MMKLYGSIMELYSFIMKNHAFSACIIEFTLAPKVLETKNHHALKKVKVLLRVKVKDSAGNEHVRCEVKQNSDNVGILRIVGDISWWNNTSEQFRAALDTMKQAGVKVLKAYMNTGGGSVWEANEIKNLISAFNKRKDRYLDLGALCCSAGTIIAEEFPVENTEAYSNITYMMHNPRIVIEGEEKDLLSHATLLSNLKSAYVKNWAKRMGLSETALSKKMDGTWWLSQDEMLKYNVVSKFKDADDEYPADVAQVLNKYKYDNVPAVLNTFVGAPPVVNKKQEQPKQSEEKPKNAMKNFITLLMATMTAIKTHLTNENASEAEVVAALNKAFQEKENKITELTNDLKTAKDKVTALETAAKEQDKKMIKQALATAVTAKKITPEQSAIFEKQAETIGLDGLNAILNTMTARTSVKDAIENNGDVKKKGAGQAKKEEEEQEEEEERTEPEFTAGENGRRIYDSAGGKSQREIMQRALQKNKQRKEK